MSQEIMVPTFNPTEIWPNNEHPELDEAIQKSIDTLNKQNPDKLIYDLLQSVEKSEKGIAYAVITANDYEGYSKEEALVLFSPFANTMAPNNLVKARFIAEAAKDADIRDDQGKLKPVVLLSSPGSDSSIQLSWDERRVIKSGDLGPAAKELLHVVAEKDFGHVALLGFSLASSLARTAAAEAYGSNLDINALSIGDDPQVEARPLIKLASDFFKATIPDLKKAVEDTGLKAQNEAYNNGTVYGINFLVSTFARPAANHYIYRGLAKDTFEQQMSEVLAESKIDRIVVGYGSASEITKPAKIEPSLQRLYEMYGLDSFTSIKVNGGKHTWGDELTLLAKLYMLALT